MENGPGVKMYFLLNMGIFQPAMLVHQRVDPRFRSSRLRLLIWSSPLTWLSFCFTTYMDLKKSMGKWRLWALKISGLIIEGTIPMVLSFFRMSERMVITWWQYSDEKHVGSHGMKYLSTNAERTIQNSGWKKRVLSPSIYWPLFHTSDAAHYFWISKKLDSLFRFVSFNHGKSVNLIKPPFGNILFFPTTWSKLKNTL